MAELDDNNGGRVVETELKPYSKPVLTCYGDVRDVTLGPTPGFGESGCACDRKPGAGGGCPAPPSPCF